MLKWRCGNDKENVGGVTRPVDGNVLYDHGLQVRHDMGAIALAEFNCSQFDYDYGLDAETLVDNS